MTFEELDEIVGEKCLYWHDCEAFMLWLDSSDRFGELYAKFGEYESGSVTPHIRMVLEQWHFEFIKSETAKAKNWTTIRAENKRYKST